MVHERVLLPTDGSDSSESAAREAIRLVKAFEATFYAVYVLNVGEPAPEPDDVPGGLREDTSSGWL